jgi:hypothetical protein
MWSDNETSSDLLGCQHVVEVVTSIVKNESLLPATIGVFGDWGSGKSSLLQIVQAKLQESEHDRKDILVLTFNGWTFEGYEDARTALMSTILDELATKTTLTAKGRRLAAKLLGRINVMRVLGAGAKAALAFGMGGPAGLGLSVGADLATNAAALWKKAGDISEEELKKFINEEPAQEARRSIREFRKDFEELIDDTRLKTLVVIIDDLDRCMPDTIIETLEAIKLFLFAHKTAFILGADERLVKYAVRKRFPELPGERVEVGRDYLEKLVQFPVRVPPLGRTEIETYINLLFAKTGGLTPEQFEQARARATTCDATSLLDVRFNHGVAAEILKPNSVPKDLAENLAMAQRIAPFLANTSGYPRQCKRFLNMVVMRLMMATARNIKLEQRVLAKLMLLEYFRPASFKKLAELQAAEQGRPSELALAEASVRPSPVAEVADSESEKEKAEGKANSGTGAKAKPKKLPAPADVKAFELPMWLSDEWTRDWLDSDPPLSELDLRPYFYFSRDTLGQIGVMMPRQSPLSQQILTELFDKSEAIRNKALKKAKDLNPDEAVSVFEALTEKARQDEDPNDDRAALRRCFDWAKARPELIIQLFTFLDNQPVVSLPAYVVVKLLDMPDSMENRRHMRRLAEKWAHQNESMRVQGIAQSRLADFKIAAYPAFRGALR